MAHKLKLPPSSVIHPVLHISQLKKKIGHLSAAQTQTPTTRPDDQVLAELIAVLGKMMIKRNNAATVEILVQWANLPPKEATWESFHHITKQFSYLDIIAKNKRHIPSPSQPMPKRRRIEAKKQKYD